MCVRACVYLCVGCVSVSVCLSVSVRVLFNQKWVPGKTCLTNCLTYLPHSLALPLVSFKATGSSFKLISTSGNASCLGLAAAVVAAGAVAAAGAALAPSGAALAPAGAALAPAGAALVAAAVP